MPNQRRAARSTQPTRIELAKLHTLHASILTRLATACDAAALRLQAAAAGQSVFGSDADLKATLALLKLLPDLLPLIAPPPPPDTRTREEKLGLPPGYFSQGPPLIPKCEICGAGPGAHWTADCPENPNPRPKVCWD